MCNYSKNLLFNIYNDIKKCIELNIPIKIIHVENIKKYSEDIENFLELNKFYFSD